MKLSDFKTTGKSTMHVKHIATGEPLYEDSDPLTGERPKGAKGEGTPVTITGYGKDSNIYKKTLADQMRKIQLELAEKYKEDENYVPDPPDREEQKERIKDNLAALITDWTGLDIECTDENKKKLMDESDSVREQWDKHVHDRSNFLGSA